LLVVLGLLIGLVGVTASPAAAQTESGAVFTMSNDAAGNEVLVYERDANGMLTLSANVPTGGNGSGDGLGSQGAVTLSDDGKWLFVVNAGSDSVSVFSVDGTNLTHTDTESSRGDRPISVDVRSNLVYVLNGASSDVSGYRFDGGQLEPIQGAVRRLSGRNVDPAQVEFSTDGTSLAVTEKATNLITIFRIMRGGRLSPASSSPSAGETPFGFEYDPNGHLVVSEAFGGAPGLSTVSTYRMSPFQVQVIETEATTQTAACWIALTSDGAFVYATNTGSNNVSRFSLTSDGDLTLLGQTDSGMGPIDMDLTGDDHFAYVVNGGSDSIGVYAVGEDGSLTLVQTVAGLPASALGLAAA
jgi:6-phosphogluconolactonase (cycloisomerase 2 family)